MLDGGSQDVKSAVRQLAETLPDDATWDDVMYRVYVRQAIDAGLRDAAEGRLVDVAEVRRQFGLESMLETVASECYRCSREEVLR
ncbi:MAG: hypothetical protein WCB27_15910 [Thermoguttaceae bacterium]